MYSTFMKDFDYIHIYPDSDTDSDFNPVPVVGS